MSNSQGTYPTASPSSSTDGEPVSNANDEELQAEVHGDTSSSDEAGDRELNTDATTWDGMESGAIDPGHTSTQSPDWLSTIPSEYRSVAAKWAEQRGVIKITPVEQRQKFTYATIAYIADHQEEPKTQIFPIVDVNDKPHQIKWDFYASTEGRVGISNAVEEHMRVEFDVYLSELIAMYWAFGGDGEYNYGLPTYENMKRRWWNAVENGTYLDFEEDIESTKAFIDFRNTFLQQHSGWVCRFASHTFGVFQGVINDVSYTIGAGESFAKWHVVIEEAIFLDGAYSKDGKKHDATETSDGSTSDSGDASSSESVETGE